MDGSVSVKLHSYIMVHAKGRGFRLSAYLNHFEVSLQLATGQLIKFEEIMYTDDCWSSLDYMIHEFWASSVTEMDVIKNMAGLLRVEYLLFSTVRQESPKIIETVVPILARGKHTSRYMRPIA